MVRMYKGIMANDPSAYIATLIEREHPKRTIEVRRPLLNGPIDIVATASNNLVRLVDGMRRLYNMGNAINFCGA